MRSAEVLMADARRAPLKDQTDISGARALIVEARFYDDIQDALMEGAVAELKTAGVTHDVPMFPCLLLLVNNTFPFIPRNGKVTDTDPFGS